MRFCVEATSPVQRTVMRCDSYKATVEHAGDLCLRDMEPRVYGPAGIVGAAIKTGRGVDGWEFKYSHPHRLIVAHPTNGPEVIGTFVSPDEAKEIAGNQQWHAYVESDLGVLWRRDPVISSALVALIDRFLGQDNPQNLSVLSALANRLQRTISIKYHPGSGYWEASNSDDARFGGSAEEVVARLALAAGRHEVPPDV